MIPENRLSTEARVAEFVPPRNIQYDPLVAYELGGVDIQNSSQGLRVKPWRGRYIDGDFILDADGVAETVVLSGIPDVTQFQFTFDQTMRPFITYMQDGNARYWWFDSTVSQQVTSTLPAGSDDVRCTLDDKRGIRVQNSDIILTYLRNNNLYFRAQRDRYLVEYLLATGLENKSLRQVGMNRGNRMQWQLVNVPEEEVT